MNINKLIKYNSNPYTAVRITFLHSEQELVEFQLQLSEIEENIFNRIVEIQINSVEFIMFVTFKDLSNIGNFLKNNNIKFKIENIVNELFEMSNLDEFISSINEETDEEIISLIKKAFPNYLTIKEIINSIFNQYNVDDVLELINNKGINILNEFHKNILK